MDVHHSTEKLTPTEARLFDDLRQQLVHLQKAEARDETDQAVRTKQYQRLFATLDGLSAVQLAETKNIVANSTRIAASHEATSQLEIGVLIVAGLIVQALILASKSVMPRVSQPSHLN